MSTAVDCVSGFNIMFFLFFLFFFMLSSIGGPLGHARRPVALDDQRAVEGGLGLLLDALAPSPAENILIEDDDSLVHFWSWCLLKFETHYYHHHHQHQHHQAANIDNSIKSSCREKKKKKQAHPPPCDYLPGVVLPLPPPPVMPLSLQSTCSHPYANCKCNTTNNTTRQSSLSLL